MSLDAKQEGPREGEIWDGIEVENPVQWALEGKSLASLLLTLGTSLAQEGDVWSLDQHPFCQAQGTHATV